MLHLGLHPCNIAPSLKTNGLGNFFHSRAPFSAHAPASGAGTGLVVGMERIRDMLPEPALTARWSTASVSFERRCVTAIGTCRRAENGGKFKGSLASQLEVLTKANAAGCPIVDLEIESALKSKRDAIARLRGRAGLIVSFHDFRATRNLEETLEKMLKVPADFYKVVSTATTLSDNVTMMKFLQTQSDKHALIGLCMGEQGIISRVLSVRAGSVFTFGAVSAEGHYRAVPDTEPELVYVVQTATTQDTYTLAEFAKKFHWKNAPKEVRLAD